MDKSRRQFIKALGLVALTATLPRTPLAEDGALPCCDFIGYEGEDKKEVDIHQDVYPINGCW